jgi:hypothetical protein
MKELLFAVTVGIFLNDSVSKQIKGTMKMLDA